MELKHLRSISRLQELFPKTYQRVLDFMEYSSNDIGYETPYFSQSDSGKQFSIGVDYDLPFTAFLIKNDDGSYKLIISMRDGTMIQGLSPDDATILEKFNQRMAQLEN